MDDPPAIHPLFTARQHEVFELLGRGRTTRQIALDLGIHYNTAQGYVQIVQRLLRALTGAGLTADQTRTVLVATPVRPLRGELAITLTARETEVLTHAALGETAQEIGALLSITEETVRNHMSSIRIRLRVHTTLEAVLEGIRSGAILVAGISPDAVVVESEPGEMDDSR